MIDAAGTTKYTYKPGGLVWTEDVLRIFFWSYISPNWHRKDFERLTGLASYYVAE